MALARVPPSFFVSSPHLISLSSLSQSKTRLELANQSAKSQHTKELESRDEDLAKQRVSMTKKLKALEQQLEEEHEHKQQAIKVGMVGNCIG